jgi:hypothetical protein
MGLEFAAWQLPEGAELRMPGFSKLWTPIPAFQRKQLELIDCRDDIQCLRLSDETLRSASKLKLLPQAIHLTQQAANK